MRTSETREAGTGVPAALDFITVPFAVLTDAEISHAAKLAYGRLKLYAGKDGRAFPKHDTLATEICITDRQLRRVLEELKDAGWISWIRARTSCVYTVHRDRTETSGQIGQKCPITSDKNVLSRSDKNVLQKRSIENHHQKRRSEKKKPQTPVKPDEDVKPEEENQTPFSQKVDDEKSKTRTPLENPEMEFRARITERHGSTVDVDRLLRHVLSDLDCGPLSGFLEADSKATTSPGSLRNPVGHYRKLARAVAREKQTEELKVAMGIPAPSKTPAAPKPEPPKNDKGRCSLCNSIGYTRYDTEVREYCDCAMGRDLKRITERMDAERKKKETETAV